MCTAVCLSLYGCVTVCPLSFNMSVYLSICSSVHFFIFHQSIFPSANLIICPSAHLLIYPSAHLPICPSCPHAVYMFIYQSTPLLSCKSVCLSIFPNLVKSICPCYTSVHLYVCVSAYKENLWEISRLHSRVKYFRVRYWSKFVCSSLVGLALSVIVRLHLTSGLVKTL